MLCQRCQTFNIHAFGRTEITYKGFPLMDVLRAANKGCVFCSLLTENLLTINEDQNRVGELEAAQRRIRGETSSLPVWSFTRSSRLSDWVAHVYHHSWVCFWVERGDENGSDGLNIRNLIVSVAENELIPGPKKTWLRLHVAAAADTPAASIGDITGQIVNQRLLTEHVLKSIREWTEDCEQNHSDCKQHLSRRSVKNSNCPPLPRRCVQTIRMEPGHWKHLLCDTKGKMGRYIALSHRWDPSTEKCRTLRSNLADRVSGKCALEPDLPHHISPLFHKICVLAWHLNVEFVWIDSLCIIQDDAADWEREATKMAEYYSFAWMTLAVTVPIDIDDRPAGDLGGQLNIEDVSGVVRMPYHDQAGTQQGYFYAQAMGPHVLAKLYETQIAQSELLRRGWCFQEWLLSRRIVSFSRDTPFMLCRNDAPRCPAGDTVDYSAMARRSNRKSRPRSRQTATDENAEASEASATLSFKTMITISPGPNQVAKTWMAVVQSYSGLHLTKFEQDRFVALAGVAREFRKALKIELASNQGSQHMSGAVESSTPAPRARAPQAESITPAQTSHGQASQHPFGVAASGADLTESPLSATHGTGSQAADVPMIAIVARQELRAQEDATEPARTGIPDTPAHDADTAVVNINEASDEPGPGHRYICGLWLDSLGHGLQWERTGPGPTARVGGIPTWSWASIATGGTGDRRLGGLSVQWAAAPDASDRDAQLFYLCRIASIPVDETTWACDFSRTVVPANDFAHANRFNVLTMVARSCQLTVHAPFATPGDSSAAAALTGHGVDVGRTHWRRVTLPGQPDVIAGWASLEHPDFAAVEEVVEVTAVFLEQRQVKGSLGWGSLRGWHWAFRMLFVRKVEVDGWTGFHERVGVGRLFGPEAKDCFEGSNEMIFNLG